MPSSCRSPCISSASPLGHAEVILFFLLNSSFGSLMIYSLLFTTQRIWFKCIQSNCYCVTHDNIFQSVDSRCVAVPLLPGWWWKCYDCSSAVLCALVVFEYSKCSTVEMISWSNHYQHSVLALTGGKLLLCTKEPLCFSLLSITKLLWYALKCFNSFELQLAEVEQLKTFYCVLVKNSHIDFTCFLTSIDKVIIIRDFNLHSWWRSLSQL